MNVIDGDYRDWVPPEGGVALTIGVFDGVHRGHRHVIDTLRRRAAELSDLPVVVATFDRHPLSVIAPERTPRLLTTREQKLELLAAAGVDATAILTFDDELRRLDPEDFASDVLAGALGATLVMVGANFRFGKGRAGDVEELRTVGLGMGFYVEDVTLIGDSGPVSSSAIRAAIAVGDVTGAAALLGRPFTVRGIVEEGDRRGRSIGFPTANLALDPQLLVPGHGVYAVRVGLDGADLPGVANVGVRPTFAGTGEVIEAHLLDYDGDLYGRSLDVAFVERLRPEQRFDGVEALAAQIARDVAAARAVLA